jgi:DNA-binding PadR family transcriptional regulator
MQKPTPAPPPLTQPMHLILLTLLERDRHGYAIMQAVEDLTAGAVTMGPGTLYGAIKRLLEAKLVVETNDRPRADLDDERRRYYRITPQGRVAAGNETRLMHRIVAFARAHGGRI